MGEKGVDKKHTQNPIIVFLYAATLFLASQLFGTILVQPLTPYIESTTVQMTCYTLAGLVVLLVLLQFNRSRKRFTQITGLLKTRGANYWRIIPTLLVYVAVSVTFTLLATNFIPAFNAEQAQDVGLPSTLAGTNMIAAFVSLVILTPIFEEIIFRGILFRGLRERLPFWVSAAIVSVLFALAHAQWNVGVDTFILSLALCYLVEKSDSIGPGIMLHAIKNLMAFIFLFVL